MEINEIMIVATGFSFTSMNLAMKIIKTMTQILKMKSNEIKKSCDKNPLCFPKDQGRTFAFLTTVNIKKNIEKAMPAKNMRKERRTMLRSY